MTQAICFKNKFGYCRYSDSCRYKHVTLVCDEGQCDIQKCEKRHPKICKYYRDFRRCKFTVGCKYKHENNQEKINNLEKQMDKQKEELEEKNAYILQLELRLGEIEKKFKEEQIRTDKRIRDLENANKSKNNEKNEDTSFKCKDCEFEGHIYLNNGGPKDELGVPGDDDMSCHSILTSHSGTTQE